MTKKKDRLFIFPQGTEGIHLEEAFRHLRFSRSLGDLFTSWGYLPVKTPVFDFYDNYRGLLEGSAGENIYRLIDREGELLVLRPDVTLFLARQMGMYLKKPDLPVRVSYADTILRHENREDISKNEFFQSGAELIGLPGFDGDMEILFLLNSCLKIFGLPFFLHLGSRRFFNELFAGNEALAAAGESALRNRDREALEEILPGVLAAGRAKPAGRNGVPPVMELLLFIGSAGDFSTRLKKAAPFLTPETVREGKYLIKISQSLAEAGFEEGCRIDLSEIGTQPYHTGVVFQVYAEGSDSAVASGGRYDKLLENFGFKAPSVGFSLLQRKLEGLAGGGPELPGKTLSAGEGNITRRFLNAEALRKKGGIVTL